MIEYVPNWFSARQEDDLGPVESGVTPTTTVKASTEVGTSSQELQTTAAETANWSTASLPAWPSTEGSRNAVKWDWSSKAEVTVEGSECIATSDGSSKTEVAEGHDGVIPTGCQPAEVADPGDTGLANGPRLLVGEEGLEGESPAQSAFWALLKDTGYEVW